MKWDRLVVKTMAGVQWTIIALLLAFLVWVIVEVAIVIARNALGLPDPPSASMRS
jgi:hypothetical protein